MLKSSSSSPIALFIKAGVKAHLNSSEDQTGLPENMGLSSLASEPWCTLSSQDKNPKREGEQKKANSVEHTALLVLK